MPLTLAFFLMWFLNTGNNNNSSYMWHYSPTLRRCLESAVFPRTPNGWRPCLWHFKFWGKVQEPKTLIYFSPLLSRRAVEALSFGEDLERREHMGRQSKPSERGGVQKHGEQEMLQLWVAEEEEGWQAWDKSVCASEKRRQWQKDSFSKPVDNHCCVSTDKGCTETSPCIANSQPTEELWKLWLYRQYSETIKLTFTALVLSIPC